jgi:hypothetical protein
MSDVGKRHITAAELEADIEAMTPAEKALAGQRFRNAILALIEKCTERQVVDGGCVVLQPRSFAKR